MRKLFLLVDTLGLLLRVSVQPDSQQERPGATAKLPLANFRSLRKIWAGSGYSGPDLAAWVRQLNPQTEVEIIKRSDRVIGFKVLPKRWVMDHTFAWLTQYRRLVKDHERTVNSGTTWIYVALIRIMLRRLA